MVEDADDFQVVALVAEEDAMVLCPEADHGRRDALELPGIAFTTLQIAAQGLADLQRDGLLDAANVGLGLVRPDNSFGHRGRLRFAAQLFPVGHGEAEFGEDSLMRNRIIVLPPLVRFRNRVGFGGPERVAVLVENSFQQVAHRAELGGRQSIDERVELLAFLKEINGHCYFLSPKQPPDTGVDWVASGEDGDAFILT